MPATQAKQHDEFFKVVFENKQIAAGYIRQFVDQALVNKLDLSKLKLEKNSYTTPKLRKYFSDIVYSCPYKETRISLSFLFEHKSRPVPYPHVQVLRYVLEIWEKNIKDRTPLQIVLPLVFYHGQEHWEYRPIESYFVHIDEDLLKYLPQFDFHLLNISSWSDEKIIALEERFLVNTLLVFKHIWDEQYILNNIQKLFIHFEKQIDTPIGKNLFQTIIVYLFKRSSFDEKMIESMIEQLQDPLQREAMSTYDVIIEKGIQKGMQKGIQKGDDQRLFVAVTNMYKDGLDAPTIAKFLGVSKERVDVIILELKQQKVL